MVGVLGDWVQVDPAQVFCRNKLTGAIAAIGEQVVKAANRTGGPLLSGLQRTVEAGIVESQPAIRLNGGASWNLDEATLNQVRP